MSNKKLNSYIRHLISYLSPTNLMATVTHTDVKNVGTNPNVLLIDVREPRELKETGIIPHSINIPLGMVEDTFRNLSDDDFKAKFGKKKPEKDAQIIVSCKTGGRSAKAQILLRNLGYTNVKNYAGGWMDWEKNLNK